MKRPFAFTVLSLAFGCLAIAGFAFTWAAPHAGAERLNALNLDVRTLAVIGLLYGSLATVVMLGLWRVASWTAWAVLIWGASLLIAMIAFQVMVGFTSEPWWLMLLPYPVFATLILATFRYVNRRSKIVLAAI
jgi:uncharacterized membrane protein (DUF2068 family)